LSLLFFGSFVHPPNIEAALRLVRQIFPAVQMRFPELKLYIVGDQPPPELSRFASEKVIITGKVPDLTPYLDRAAVVVIPLSSGAGMRVKTLEALAAGKAVVATGMAISGLNLAEGEQVLLADEDKDLVEAVACLLAHPEQRAALAKGARAWASANLGWKKSIEAYEELYRALISRPGRAGGSSLPDD
jgi:glycosyltransferase involved in cell wall biosynthesis